MCALKQITGFLIAAFAVAAPTVVAAEILAMVNYETKATQAFRKEGIAIIDVDPNSGNFGKVLSDMPLPHDLHPSGSLVSRNGVAGASRGAGHVDSEFSARLGSITSYPTARKWS